MYAIRSYYGSSSGALLVALEDDDEEVRRRAAMALERMGYVREGIGILEKEGFRPDIYRVLLQIRNNFV